MYYLCTMCIGLWPAAPRNLKKWPMANFELETPGLVIMVLPSKNVPPAC